MWLKKYVQDIDKISASTSYIFQINIQLYNIHFIKLKT